MKNNVRWDSTRACLGICAILVTQYLVACGGGGNDKDSGTNKTMLRAEALDSDGDKLDYEWRVTGGSIENRNARETVWTMPDGPGLHFAYLLVSDGRGGYAEQQYAVSTDALETAAPQRPARSPTPVPVTQPEGATQRLQFFSPDDTRFAVPGSDEKVARRVYLPDVRVEVVEATSGQRVFSGVSDTGGYVDLPQLPSSQSYIVRCSSSPDAALQDCVGNFRPATTAQVTSRSPLLPASQNLRVFGHVMLADGAVCGYEDEFAGAQSAATVQLRQSDGTALSQVTRVNRFGDYALDMAVPVNAALKLVVTCGTYTQDLDVPASADPSGYISTSPVELSHTIPNVRPRVLRVLANGPDGSVRGRMVVPQAGVASNQLPGSDRFLTAKGKDTRLSACMYYRAIGAVKSCDAQGNMVEPISLEDWKRQKKLKPYQVGNGEVTATYINKMDLNLVRRMVATQSGADDYAFYVCNYPGPERFTQQEINELIARALRDERRVACVAMEWSTTPGANGGRPFTKFLTFGPDGSLVPSINLDTRGEKYMPGACVACHGGTQYNGRFPEKGTPSPNLGARFLAFDAGNYYFSTDNALTEQAQGDALYMLNQFVRATEPSPDTPTSKLIEGWYAHGSHAQDKTYVPPAWQAADAMPATAGAARFYREVVGTSCRTCHAALGQDFDWDSIVLSPSIAQRHVCGGTQEVAYNASMPNALVTRDRLQEKVSADATLATLMTRFLGCASPRPDPAFPRR